MINNSMKNKKKTDLHKMHPKFGSEKNWMNISSIFEWLGTIFFCKEIIFSKNDTFNVLEN